MHLDNGPKQSRKSMFEWLENKENLAFAMAQSKSRWFNMNKQVVLSLKTSDIAKYFFLNLQKWVGKDSSHSDVKDFCVCCCFFVVVLCVCVCGGGGWGWGGDTVVLNWQKKAFCMTGWRQMWFIIQSIHCPLLPENKGHTDSTHISNCPCLWLGPRDTQIQHQTGVMLYSGFRFLHLKNVYVIR